MFSVLVSVINASRYTQVLEAVSFFHFSSQPLNFSAFVIICGYVSGPLSLSLCAFLGLGQAVLILPQWILLCACAMCVCDVQRGEKNKGEGNQ